MSLPVTVSLLLATALATAQDPAPVPAPEVQQPKVLAVGEMLPKDLALHDLDGKVHKLADLHGKVVVLHFWSDRCPAEVLAEPKINTLTKDYEKKDVIVFGVAANAGEIGEKPEPKAFEEKDATKRPYAGLRKKAAESAVNHAILADHGAVLGKLLDAKTTPHTFVIGKDGALAYTGALDDDANGKNPERAANFVRNAVDALLDGKKVEVSTTKPYG